MLKDLYHSLPQNYGIFTSDDERDGMVGVAGVSGNIFQEIDGRQFDSPVLGTRRQKGGFGKGKGKANFATERERREQLNVKYGALRSLFPNPTKVCITYLSKHKFLNCFSHYRTHFPQLHGFVEHLVSSIRTGCIGTCIQIVFPRKNKI